MALRKRIEHSAGAVVVHETGERVLMIWSIVGRGGWGFPKGHIKPGESSLQAAKRETEEEAGLSKNNLKFLSNLDIIHQIIRYPANYEEVHRDTAFFLLQASSEIITRHPTDGQHDTAMWVPWNDVEAKKLRYSYVSTLLQKAKGKYFTQGKGSHNK